MNSSQLGKKLKEARLVKKMTQSDVAGTFITRNMLSQIESGAASPSLRTLEYLANTLELPIHYLISESEQAEANGESAPEISALSEPANYEPPVFLRCKSAYIRGDYAYVIEHAGDLDAESSLYYDEGAALLARSYLQAAKHARNDERPRANKSAIAYARLAARYGEVGIYASREVRTEALLLLDELSEIMNN